MQPHIWQLLVVTIAGWLNRYQQDAVDYLKEENRILREHVGGRRLRFTDEQRRRLAAKARVLGRDGMKEVAGLVTPDTLLRWYTQLIAKKYDGSKRRGPGRPRVAETIREFVVRMATQNSTWGYTRICGALRNLGHDVGRNTVKRILAEHGIEPAPTPQANPMGYVSESSLGSGRGDRLLHGGGADHQRADSLLRALRYRPQDAPRRDRRHH